MISKEWDTKGKDFLKNEKKFLSSTLKPKEPKPHKNFSPKISNNPAKNVRSQMPSGALAGISILTSTSQIRHHRIRKNRLK